MSLTDHTVVVLLYPQYQELDFWYCVLRAREEGATVAIVGSEPAGSTSVLGYPAVPDAVASDLDPAGVSVVIAPGVALGATPASAPEQRALVAAVRAAGGLVAAVGNGHDVVRAALPDAAPGTEVLAASGTNELASFFGDVRARLGAARAATAA
jgi:protease I